MAVIRFGGFLGENRAIEPKLLADSVLTVSQNQKPGRGDLRSWRRTTVVATIPSGRSTTIYRMGRDVATDAQYWHSWNTVVHAVRGFSAADTTEQTFYTGDGYPKFMNNLTLDGSNPQDNPAVYRPMGLPAPLTALTTSPGSVTTIGEGKYEYLITQSMVDGLIGGDVFRITIDGDTDNAATITLNEDPTLRQVTLATLTAQLDPIAGISAAYSPATSTSPAGVQVLSDAVGKNFLIEKRSGTQESYAWADVTQTDYLLGSAVGSAFTNVVIGTTIGASSMIAGRVYRINSVGTTDFTQYGAPNNNSLTVFTATGPATGTGTVDNVTSSTAASYTCSVTITPSMIAAMPVGRRFAVTVNSEAPVMVTVGAGSGTFPAAVTADSVKTAFAGVSNVTATISTNTTTGARSVVLTMNTVYSASTLRLRTITPGTTNSYVTVLQGTQITASSASDVSTFYVYTYVNDLGWESAPSPVSAEDVRNPEATSTLSGFATPPSGNYNINTIRIYKTQTGSNTNFYFLREVAVGTTSTTDDNRSLGELLETSTWLPAPGIPTGGSLNTTEPNLTFLTAMWNGMMAGITGNSVRVCEPYSPYAWPAAYDVIPPDGKPVGLGVFGQNLLVLTTSRPVLVNGSSPDGLDQQKIEMPQGCIAPRSIVSMGAGVAWASEDGLCWYGAGGPRLLTAGIMLREDWQYINPSSIIACMYEGLYFASYLDTATNTRKGFVIDPANPQGIYFLSLGYDSMYFDELRDHLYVCRGTQIEKWDSAPDVGEGAGFLYYFVRSKQFKQPFPQSYGAAEVVASAYPVTFKLYADNELVHTQTVTSRNPFRLPAKRAMDFLIQLEGTNPVQGVAIATTMKELSEV